VLSKQIHLDELTKALLRLAMENAGAQHGRLVLYQGDCWKIKAVASAEELHLLEPAAALDLEQTLVPLSLVRECTHRREPVLLDDAQTSRFSADPYFSTTKTRSVICLPLQSNQRLAGLIYLENNLAAGLFAQQRLEVLQTLAAQMAISLETASHFQQLQDQHKQILSERESRHDEAMRAQSLQARKDALASFLAIASHDLKNPLASILLWNRQIVRHNDPEIERATHSIETACRRANSLVSTYLDVVASETEGSIRLQRQHCDLTALIEDEIDFQLHCLPVEQRGLAGLAWDLEPVEAFVDAERIRQVVGNLVSNALKYCPTGTPLEVILTEDKADRTIRLEVKDEGPGIAEELQAALFQPFERRIHTSPGSGLGLWICRLIVEAHAGELGLVSKTGDGCLFWVSIPAH
jgi:signal transduction histidine kinase